MDNQIKLNIFTKSKEIMENFKAGEIEDQPQDTALANLIANSNGNLSLIQMEGSEDESGEVALEENNTTNTTQTATGTRISPDWKSKIQDLEKPGRTPEEGLLQAQQEIQTCTANIESYTKQLESLDKSLSDCQANINKYKSGSWLKKLINKGKANAAEKEKANIEKQITALKEKLEAEKTALENLKQAVIKWQEQIAAKQPDNSEPKLSPEEQLENKNLEVAKQEEHLANLENQRLHLIAQLEEASDEKAASEIEGYINNIDGVIKFEYGNLETLRTDVEKLKAAIAAKQPTLSPEEQLVNVDKQIEVTKQSIDDLEASLAALNLHLSQSGVESVEEGNERRMLTEQIETKKAELAELTAEAADLRAGITAKQPGDSLKDQVDTSTLRDILNRKPVLRDRELLVGALTDAKLPEQLTDAKFPEQPIYLMNLADELKSADESGTPITISQADYQGLQKYGLITPEIQEKIDNGQIEVSA